MGNTFSERLQRAKKYLADVAAHNQTLPTRWISEGAMVNASLSRFNPLNNKRNALKARSQEAKSKKILDEPGRFCSQVKALLRIDFPKETWRDFGFRKGENSRIPTKQEAAS